MDQTFRSRTGETTMAVVVKIPEETASFAVVELMGHVRLAGRISEEERFGGKYGRIDIPQDDGSWVTQYFGAQSVYRITPVTEEVARAVAKRSQPEPAYAWDVRRALGLQEQPAVKVDTYEPRPDPDEDW